MSTASAHRRTGTLLRHLSKKHTPSQSFSDTDSCSSKKAPRPLHTKTAPCGDGLDQEYDFIIVGGGTSGCILAKRLSNNPAWNILLIEAGSITHDTWFIAQTPASYTDLQLTDIDWQFKTVPQEQQFNRQSLWPRGKTLGGCSTINALLYVRGDAKGYDEWARLGCEGWSYQDLLPLFKRQERIVPGGHAAIDKDYHGTHGDWEITVGAGKASDHTVAARNFVRACNEVAGIEMGDYNGANPARTSLGQYTIDSTSRRSSTARSFLRTNVQGGKPPMQRSNLTVATSCLVSQVVTRGKSKQCVGVLVLREGQEKPLYVPCRKEIILCAGAVQTPQILLLSGIGPKEEIEKVTGITPLHDLPGVGRNLQDHLFVPMLWPWNGGGDDELIVGAEHISTKIGILAKYLLTGGGAGSISPVQALAFQRTGLDPTSDKVDLQYHFVPAFQKTDRVSETMNLPPSYGSQWDPSSWHDFKAAAVPLPSLLTPKSRGTIRLQSANPRDHPIIDPQYLSHPYDLAVLVHGMRQARKIMRAKAFGGHPRHMELLDSSISHRPDSTEYLEAYVRKCASTIYHPVGTAKMGPSSDRSAVVDPQLCVIGMHGLRVADASIMPTICCGNTNAPAAVIAEKAADLIRQTWS